MRHCRRMKFRLRSLLQIEVAVVAPVDERGRPARTTQLSDIARDISDSKAAAALAGGIRARTMDQQQVMQRHLARSQYEIDGLALVDIGQHGLAARQHVVPIAGVAMHERRVVAARNNPHAAIPAVRWRKGQPGGRRVGRAQSPIGRVLMPGHVVRLARPLVEKTGAPAQNVRPQHALDRIEDALVVNQLPKPGHQQVRLDVLCRCQPPGPARLDPLQPRQILGHFFGRQRGDRGQKPLPAVMRDGVGVQTAAHAGVPSATSSKLQLGPSNSQPGARTGISGFPRRRR